MTWLWRRCCYLSYLCCVWWWIMAGSRVTVVAASPSGNGQGEETDDVVVLHCPMGWGYANKQEEDHPLQPIRQNQMDDGYCDCPVAGDDEPNTEACSGREFWPGITRSPHHTAEPHIFVCPQQPNVHLPLSRLHDGICDCCDGADEMVQAVVVDDGSSGVDTTDQRSFSSSSSCPDQCEQMLAAERAARQRLVQSYRSGGAQRQKQIEAFQVLKQQTREQWEVVHTNLQSLRQELNKVRFHFHNLKRIYLMGQLAQIRARTLRLAAATATTTASTPSTGTAPPLSSGLLQSLDAATELYWFIVHACQLAGEMEGSTGKTCVPLRLAGLDAAILWEHQTYNVTYVDYSPIFGENDKALDDAQQMHLQQQQLLADLLDFNLHSHSGSTGEKVWNAHGLQRQQKRTGGDDSGPRHHHHPHRKPGHEKLPHGHRHHKPRRHSESRRERPRRRLSTLDDGADFDLHDYEDDEARYSLDDDDMSEDDEDADNGDVDLENTSSSATASAEGHGQDSTGNADNVSTNNRDDLSEMLLSRSFSQSRASFLERAETILGAIQNITQEKQTDEAESDNSHDEKVAEGSASTSDETVSSVTSSSSDDAKSLHPPIDPMLLPMVRNKIEQRQRSIRRGLDYGTSAKVLLDAVQQASTRPGSPASSGTPSYQETMYALAIGTLNHGQLSAWHYWQLLVHVLPEVAQTGVVGENGDNNTSASSSSETCGASWILSAPRLCPPRTVQRGTVQGQVVTIPPAAVVGAVESYCKQEEAALLLSLHTTTTTTTDAACQAAPESESQLNASSIIPPDVPDGFAGYLPPTPRGANDLLDQLFMELKWGYDAQVQGQLDVLRNETVRLEQHESALQSKLKEMEDLLGGDEAGRYGPDGELYALKDTCHSITSGKYTYELCMFKSARQNEGDGPGGTDLGRWTEAVLDIDEEGNGTGDRVWKWEGGAKCWNGPERSATAHVKCGPDNKVLSADEPETCKYSFAMESYVACDENFRKRHELDAL